jgi:hypothetical protein
MSPRRSLAVLAGARPEILAKATGDLTKHAVMGGVLLSTAGLAAVSAFYALRSTLGVAVPAAVLCAVVWFVIILNLDRLLVVTLNTAAGWQAFWVAMPRFLMAAVIGTIVATPLTLQIFHQEIEAELQNMHAELIIENQAKLDEAYQQISDLQQQEKELQDAIAGRNTDAVSADPDVKAAQAVYDAAQTAYLDAQKQAQCELNGGCGTGTPGVGTAYRTAQATADEAKRTADDAKAKLDAAKSEAEGRIRRGSAAAATEAKQKLGDVQHDLAVAQDNKRRAESENQDAAENSTGLLARVEALDRITAGHATAQAAKWALSALFFLIEVLPVVSKLLMMVGKKTTYDTMLARHDADLDDEDAQKSAAAKALVQYRIDAQTKAGQDRVDQLVAAQAAISANAIQTWADLARLRADEQLDDWYRQHVGPVAARRAAVVPPLSTALAGATTVPMTTTQLGGAALTATAPTGGTAGNASAATTGQHPGAHPVNGSSAVNGTANGSTT